MAEAHAAPVPTTTPTTHDLEPSQLLSVYRQMVLARSLDERCLALQRQGRIGFYVPLQGQEAAQVGSAWGIREEDWIFPAYREMAVALVRGIPLELLLNQFYGNSGDELRGRQMPNHFGFRRFRFVTASSPVGTQITHAVGAGMAARRRGDAIATICYFGDGTTSSNDFHAGLNFAGVFQAPTIFFCQNNQWAISMPRERQTKSATLAEKASAYGFPGIAVDGMDFHAVYRAVSEARARAASGKGPTLIEAQVYRFGPHSTSDDPRRYRTDAELAQWKEKDPIARMSHELRSAALLTAEQDQAIWDAAKQEVAKAVATAEQVGPVEPLSLFDDVYAKRIPTLEAQRTAFAGLLERRGATS